MPIAALVRAFKSLLPAFALFSCILTLVFLSRGPEILLYVDRLRGNGTSSYTRPSSWEGLVERQRGSDIFNRTLGFEKVLAIGMPERTDKRDALALASALTNFSITWVDGVKGADVVDKALPMGWKRPPMRNSNLGSWRGHINAMRTIVDQRLSSALIMEDDMDWDVSIKGQLAVFAAAAKDIQTDFDQTPAMGSKSPYGQAWDLLWVGSCVATFDELLNGELQIPEPQRNSRKVFINDDPTVPSLNHKLGLPFKWDSYPQATRIVHVPGDNVCTFAYALSYAGAQKALEYMSLEGQHKPFDNHLSDLCRLRANGMRCVSIVPALFVHHRPKGNTAGDSDINGPGDKGEIRQVGMTENILYSTRLNLKNLLVGAKPEKQWAD